MAARAGGRQLSSTTREPTWVTPDPLRDDGGVRRMGALPRRERFLVVMLIAVAIAVGALAWRSELGRAQEEGAAIGTFLAASGEPRRRSRSGSLWRSFDVGHAVRAGDTLFAPPGGAITVLFADGNQMSLAGGTLIRLASALELRRGRIDLTTESPAAVTVRGEQVDVQGDSRIAAELRADGGVHLELGHGGAAVGFGEGSVRLAPGFAAHRARPGERWQRSALPVKLLEPGLGETIYFDGERPTISLRWRERTDGAVQIAAAWTFADATTLRVDSNRIELPSVAAGHYWWRVVDEAGLPVSAASAFTVVERRPPVPLYPLAEEVVFSPTGYLRFFWRGSAGVSDYRLEIAADADFGDAVTAQSVAGTRVSFAERLDEGVYYWRVRSLDGHLASTPTPFRVIHRTVLGRPVGLSTGLVPGNGPDR